MNNHSSNRLAACISPYLQQHASNPVHWQPWDELALAEARRRDVPILLSIGYASCHWCHVMEHESFADLKTAALMNEHFVCVKVDREERPDLDKTYQAAHYLLSRKTGGWPLTVFLDETLIPFFTGTYFPPVPRGGLMALSSVLGRVHKVWCEHREEIKQQRKMIWDALRNIDEPATDRPQLSLQNVKNAVAGVQKAFDLDHGGLGQAPKFPQSPHLGFALQMTAAGHTELEKGLRKTLDAMAIGGLHDHVGGGFYRYCVDPIWDIPHFEKMLYDNAQLLEIYARGASLWQSSAYGYIARRTAKWMLADLQLNDGGFASGVDADSEGQEGKFYVWSSKQLEHELNEKQLTELRNHTNYSGAPNFEGEYHLHQPPDSDWASPSAQVQEIWRKLRDIRSMRPKPMLDDKALIISCALAAQALTIAGRYLNEPDWIAQARRSLNFVEHHMKPEKHYRTAWNKGSCSDAPAFLDDLVSLLSARINLLQSDCRAEDLNHATKLADLIIAEYDDGKGGLLFVPKEADIGVRKIRSCDDGPLPSGNGMAAGCLLTLGWLLGRTDYLEVGDRIIGGFSNLLATSPFHSPVLVASFAAWLNPTPIVILSGESEKISNWHEQLLPHTHAGQIILPLYDLTNLPSSIVKPKPSGACTIWAHLCRGNTCSVPIVEIKELISELRSNNLKIQN